MEGAPHTAKRTIDVPLGCPPPPYIKEGGRRGRPKGRRAIGGGNLLQVGFPLLFPNRSRRGKEEGGGKKERGAAPLPIRFGLGGARLPLGRLLLSPTMAH